MLLLNNQLVAFFCFYCIAQALVYCSLLLKHCKKRLQCFVFRLSGGSFSLKVNFVSMSTCLLKCSELNILRQLEKYFFFFLSWNSVHMYRMYQKQIFWCTIFVVWDLHWYTTWIPSPPRSVFPFTTVSCLLQCGGQMKILLSLHLAQETTSTFDNLSVCVCSILQKGETGWSCWASLSSLCPSLTVSHTLKRSQCFLSVPVVRFSLPLCRCWCLLFSAESYIILWMVSLR